MASGQFPAAIRLGPRLVAWPSHAIDQYIQTQIDATRTGAYAPRIVGKRRPK
jgi:predicted DNA-binding transcriptional regulator AlpA